MSETDTRTKVIILTQRHFITGEVANLPTARLTDYILEAKPFIAVTNAVLLDHDGRRILSTPFLDIARDKIEMIMPAGDVEMG